MRPSTEFGRQSVADWAAALGLKLDDHQRMILDPAIRRGILNCCRKWGKSTMIALKAAHFAAHRPGSTVLMVAAAARQSDELLKIAARMLRKLVPGVSTAQSKIELPNGSRILALPNHPETIRGYAADLLVIDEAAYLDDAMWDSVFPMLNAAEGGGWLWLMSTPSQPTGFFYRILTNGEKDWVRLTVAAPDCPRIPAAIIEEARRSFQPKDFAREYLCEFQQAPTAAFPESLVRQCLDPTLPEFWGEAPAPELTGAPRGAKPDFQLGNDFGKDFDPSALVIVEFQAKYRGTVDPATRAPLFDCSLAVRHIESPPLGTDYLDVGALALRLAAHPRMQGKCTVVADANGAGAPVVEYMRRPPLTAPIVAVKTTGGDAVRQVDGNWHVSKKVMMDRLDWVIRNKKLRIAKLPLSEALIRELTLMERDEKPSGSVTYSTPSARVHDDLAMATAMAVWRAWEVHGSYLKIEGPVPIVSDAGVLHVTHQHPLLRGLPPVRKLW